MDSMQKGKIAEKIVGDMFKEAGFKVVKYGYEHTVKTLADKNNLIKGRAADYIRHQPDFIVVNKNNEAFFVEVKHRSKAIMPSREIFPYPNCYVVLLTKGAILAQSTHFLFNKRASFGLLVDMPPFKDIPFPIIEKYIMKLRRQLGDDTLVKQFMGKLVERMTNRTLPVKPADPITIIGQGKRIIRKFTNRSRNTRGRTIRRPRTASGRSKGNVPAQRRRYKQRRN